MRDDFDPKGEKDLSHSGEKGSPEIASANPYPVRRSLGEGDQLGSFLCEDRSKPGRMLVKRWVPQEISSRIPDLVSLGFSRLSGLAHPGLVLVQDYGWEEENAFLIRDWVEGIPILKALENAGVEKILRCFAQLFEVMNYLHSQNTPHLHLTSENIFLTKLQNSEETQIRVSDFGLAQHLDRALPFQEKLVGTPPFTAPEYAQNPSPNPRADHYSIGALLYTALSGRLPFEGADGMAIHQVQLKKDPPPLRELLPEIPAKLSDFVQRLLSREPKERYTSLGEALGELEGILGKPLLEKNYSPPPIFSDLEDAFHYKKHVKMFRRIALQGRRWAFQGKRGCGKSFFARWLHRYFSLNKMTVRFFSGEDISLLEGEFILNPAQPVFVIIDDADKGDVLAWLEIRPYQHIVVFGEELEWAKNDSRWQVFPLDDLTEEELSQILEKSWGPSEKVIQREFFKRGWQHPATLVQEARALVRHHVVQKVPGEWKFSGEKFYRGLGSSQGPNIADPLHSLKEDSRKILTLLILTQVPFSTATLARWLGMEEKSISATLTALVPEGLAHRRVWMGKEYFFSSIIQPGKMEIPVQEKTIRSWIEGMYADGWYEAGLVLINKWFSEGALEKDHSLLLLKAKLLDAIGRHEEVFQIITSPFVKSLSHEQVGMAFEILGASLAASEKRPQAETALKRAFKQYQTEENHQGEARVLRELGALSLKAGDQERALKYYGQALSLAENLAGEGCLLGVLQYYIAELYAQATDYENAELRYQSSLEILFEAGDYLHLAKAYLSYARMLLARGEVEVSEYYIRELLNLALFKKAWAIQGEGYLLLANLAEESGNMGMTMERLNEAVFAFARSPNRHAHSQALVRRAYFLENNRQGERAEEDARTTLKLAQGLKDVQLAGQAHLVLGKVLRHDRKKLDEAMKHFEMAAGQLEKSQDLLGVWECEFEKGEIERNRGNPANARAFYDQALHILDQYTATLAPGKKEKFMQEGKREQVEMAIRWLE